MLFLICSACKNFVRSFHKSPLAAIQPLDDFHKTIIDSICGSVEGVYGFGNIILNKVNLPESAFVHTKVPRYRADSLLRFLTRIKPIAVKLSVFMFLKHNLLK